MSKVDFPLNIPAVEKELKQAHQHVQLTSAP